MSNKSKIEWTDATWNPVTGCTKVSQGCKFCYAERDWSRLGHLPAFSGRQFTDVATHPERLRQPLSWKKPRRIFVNSMSDLFHESVPDSFIDEVFAIMAICPQHTFQILTKRPERMREYLRYGARQELIGICAEYVGGLDRHLPDLSARWKLPLQNVWLGVSIENQQTADERIPLLLDTPAAVRWISAEPLLGPVDLMNCEHPNYSIPADYISGQDSRCGDDQGTLDWVVVGGESGPKARPTHPSWAETLRDQCAAASVPFLFKQWGEWFPARTLPASTLLAYDRWCFISEAGGSPEPMDGRQFDFTYEKMGKIGKTAAGRLLDGVQHDGYPVEAPF